MGKCCNYSFRHFLWAVSPRKYGGLSYSTENVGQVLAISGAKLILVFPIYTCYETENVTSFLM